METNAMETLAGGISERAPAKVNLALHVLRRRADGYHELDSLVAFVPQAADVVRIAAAARWGLEVTGPLAEGVPADESNLALRAAMALHRRWPEMFGPVRIALDKRLPAAAGIGGGSADAAAVLRAMWRLAGLAPPRQALEALALELGADVPVCLHAQAARMRGIGERLTPVRLPSGLGVVLANPGVRISTAKVFAHLAQTRRTCAPVPDAALPEALPGERDAFLAVLRRLRNDLEPVARAMAPAIDECLHALAALPDCLLARMSGSGATCFALFADVFTARAGAAALRRKHPAWWIAAGTLQ